MGSLKHALLGARQSSAGSGSGLLVREHVGYPPVLAVTLARQQNLMATF